MLFRHVSETLTARSLALEAAVGNEAPADPGTGPGTEDHQQWLAAWSAALTELELDVSRVEQVLVSVHHGAEMPPAAEILGRRWEAPAALGPLPHPLLARAKALLMRQQQMATDVAEATGRTRLHAQAASSIRDRPPAEAVYLDLAL